MGRPTAASKSLETKKKRLGAFYTPSALTDILCTWAVTHKSETIFEPSFGGCGFLQSAKARLVALSAKNAESQIYGCDVDKAAFRYLPTALGSPLDLSRFALGDFLDFTPPRAWPKDFSVIVANPPYIPFQKLTKKRRKSLLHGTFRVALTGRASLWAYFLSHALNFLSSGGSTAWVLPGAFLQTYYAEPLRKYFANNFARAMAITLRERVFLAEGTDEETIILLAQGHGQQSKTGRLETGEANSVSDLVRLIEAWDTGLQKSSPKSDVEPDHGSVHESFATLTVHSKARTFGEFARVKIGLVTGANDFFVLSREDLRRHQLLARDCYRVFGKFKAMPGVRCNSADHAHFMNEGGNGYLVDSKKLPNARLKKYFGKFKPAARGKVKTFKKRSKWSSSNDGQIPDAFFPVMHHQGPRIAINDARLNCTNTLHRVYFNEGVSKDDQKLLAISILSSFSQISAERIGRKYGSGVLKHEPREAEKICILLPALTPSSVRKAYEQIDRKLRSGKWIDAVRIADKVILEPICGDNWQKVSSDMISALSEIREKRQPNRALKKLTAIVPPTSP